MSDDSKVHVAWLSGSYHLRNSMMKKIRNKFSDFEYIVVDEETPFEFLMSKIRSGGCFDSGRLICILGLPKTKNPAEKKKYLTRIKALFAGEMENCFVVFNGIDTGKERALFNAVKDFCKLYDYQVEISPKESAVYIGKRLKAHGLTADTDVCYALGEYCGKSSGTKGYDADKIEMAITSLRFALGEKAQITREHIESITFNYDEFVIWDMMNALDAKDCEQVMALVSKMGATASSFNRSITDMLTTLIWRYRLILMIREGYSTKDSREQILADIASMRKMTKTGTGLSAIYEPMLLKSGANEGDPAPVWSPQVASIAMDGMYGGSAAVDQWNRGQIYRFVWALSEGLKLLRGATESESLIIADSVLMLGCDLLDMKNVKKVLSSIQRVRDVQFE